MTQLNVPDLPERPVDRALAQLSGKAIEILRSEQPALFQEVVMAFNGKRFDVALFGEGKFHVAVDSGEIQVLPFVMGSAVAYRVGGYPSAIADIAEGRLTPLEGFFRAAIVAFGSAKDLSVGHAYILKLTKFAQSSRAMQNLVAEFKTLCKL
ncbi:MAG: hypothetical protein M3178_10950 [Pseudomonadota bacterium]|nr:hypothetical protein [Pseudomonadota bacterium]